MTGHPIYSCRKCRNPIALHQDLLSKSFKAKTGQAFMFGHAMNIVVGAKEDKQLMTGYYTIANIFCSKCGEEMGWTYVRAFDAREKYKEGRYIVEKAKIVKEY
ncbi:UNVERIFIED_CONTAM: protein yippee-like [Sesamum latifolium]|uniref:Protein yippee-like n=1 Tax=Sesamum latifolium TaxID=2727402 RepID=A0AAW2XF26_9LAMI